MDRSPSHPFAVVTGASSGIDLELGTVCAEHGYDLLATAEDPGVAAADAVALNAGVGGAFAETDLRAELNLINLSVVSVTNYFARADREDAKVAAGKSANP
jgi:short-subunit dehydrogenase